MLRWPFLILFGLILLVGVTVYSNSSTHRQLDRMAVVVREAAPVGKQRAEVENSLNRAGLEHAFSISEEAIYGQKNAGHFMLAYRTIFIYKIKLDRRERVLSVETTFFNEGL